MEAREDWSVRLTVHQKEVKNEKTAALPRPAVTEEEEMNEPKRTIEEKILIAEPIVELITNLRN